MSRFMLVAALACVVIIAGVPGGECKPKLKIKGGGTVGRGKVDISSTPC